MRVFAFDTETHLIEPGILAPKLVVGAFYSEVEGGEAFLLYPDDTVTEVSRRLAEGWYIVGANIFYDFGVLLHHALAMGVYEELRDRIFAALDEGRVWDVQIAEALYALAQGHLRRNPDTGETFSRYSLTIVLELTTGKKNAKEHDEWRLRYGELDGIPIEQWPNVAQVYPIDDVRNTLECYQKQAGRGYSGEETNAHDLPAQCRAAWAMHLGAIWGFRIDQGALNEYEREVTEVRGGQIAVLTAAGVLRSNGSKDIKAIARRVVDAYAPGGESSCPLCQATGQVLLPPILGKRGQQLKPRVTNCVACSGLGVLLNGRPVPRTETGRVSTSRDTLYESGDETLRELGELGLTDKALSTYIPYLRQADGVPLTLQPNVLLETGRASYSGVIQLLPRQGKERECFIPRPGYLFFSVDYEGLELATHAQSCLNLFGQSKLAEVLNAGGKPHDMLAAKLYGKSDAAFAALLAAGDKRAKDLRQSAKPANFGFPGFMGAVRLVIAQREQGPDTTAPDGTIYHGLRFCILMGYSTSCGDVKKYEHNGKPISPTCTKCIEAAQDLRATWMLQWPENQAYFAFILDRVERVGYIKQHFSNRVRGRIDVSSAANGYFQSLAADGAKRALYAVARAQYCDRASPLWGSRTILFAHDELLGEAPIARASEVAEEVVRIMVAEMSAVCPDVAIRAEPTLMRRWYKQATCVRDAKGKIIPWESK